MMKKKWENMSREDLKFIPTMLKAGYLLEFRQADIKEKRTTPERVPLWPVGFRNHTYYIYRSPLDKKWTAIDLSEDWNNEVRQFKRETLQEVLTILKIISE